MISWRSLGGSEFACWLWVGTAWLMGCIALGLDKLLGLRVVWGDKIKNSQPSISGRACQALLAKSDAACCERAVLCRARPFSCRKRSAMTTQIHDGAAADRPFWTVHWQSRAGSARWSLGQQAEELEPQCHGRLFGPTLIASSTANLPPFSVPLRWFLTRHRATDAEQDASSPTSTACRRAQLRIATPLCYRREIRDGMIRACGRVYRNCGMWSPRSRHIRGRSFKRERPR